MQDDDAAHEEVEPCKFHVTAYRCRCGHEWVPAKIRQTQPPRVCPRCKSPNWDKPHLFRRPDLQGSRTTLVITATTSGATSEQEDNGV